MRSVIIFRSLVSDLLDLLDFLRAFFQFQRHFLAIAGFPLKLLEKLFGDFLALLSSRITPFSFARICRRAQNDQRFVGQRLAETFGIQFVVECTDSPSLVRRFEAHSS
jgi:hypothetical protein